MIIKQFPQNPKKHIHDRCNISMQYPGGILHLVHLPKADILVYGIWAMFTKISNYNTWSCNYTNFVLLFNNI